MSGVEARLRDALRAVPDALAAHVMRVAGEAQRLAPLHGVDVRAVTIAALGHDVLRAEPAERLLAIAREQRHEPDDSERLKPVLMHGPLGATLLRERYGIDDAEVLGAAAWHTTAHAGMTTLQKLLFIADKIEPGKMSLYGPRARVRQLADTDLNAAMRIFLDYHIAYALAHRWPVHPHTIAARNELLAGDPP